MQTPASTSTTSSRSAAWRHSWPRPRTKYQISSTLWCATAFDVAPAASSKWARLPPFSRRRTRTDEPSGAIASGAAGSRIVANAVTCLQEAAVSALVGQVEAEGEQLAVHVRLVGVADLRVADRLQAPADELRHVGRVGAAEHVEGGRIPLAEQMLRHRLAARRLADALQEVIAHLRVAELVALDGGRHLGQRHVGGLAPVARVEGAVEIDEEVEVRVVRPRLARQVERVVRVGHVLQREVALEPDGQPVEHDRDFALKDVPYAHYSF